MTRRQAIQLSPEEQREFLLAAKTIILSTIDPHGYPHAVAMWYVVDDDGSVVMTTYGKSQKAMNVRRDQKVALLAESGETYGTLKGVLIRGRAEILEDFELCLSVISRVHRKMTGAFAEGVEQSLRRQASKRVVIRVVPERRSSWDHAKLAGSY